MSKLKINVGRKKLSSEYIASKQNFDHVLKGAKSMQAMPLKGVWFYGVVGLASVATIAGIYFYQFNQQTNETNITSINQREELLQEQENEQKQEVVLVNEDNSEALLAQTELKLKEITPTQKVVKTTSETKMTEIALKQAEIDKKISSELIAVIDAPLPKSPKVVLPSIAGVYKGEISWEKFKDGVLSVGEDVQITKYSIQYTTRMGDKTISVNGNSIPEEVKQDLEKLGMNQTIFITNVIGLTDAKESMRFVSMELNLKFK